MAITATFSIRGTLDVLGDSLSNEITVSRNAAGTLFVNSGAVPIVASFATGLFAP